MVKRTKKMFAAENFKETTLKNLDELKFNKKVVELDRKQPEFKLNFNQYLKRYLNDKNKNRLRKKFNENKILLKKLKKNLELIQKF